MGISKDRGYWYFVKRVPKRFAHVDSRIKVSRALWTDSERLAREKAAAVEAEFMAYWEALAAGKSNDASAQPSRQQNGWHRRVGSAIDPPQNSPALR